MGVTIPISGRSVPGYSKSAITELPRYNRHNTRNADHTKDWYEASSGNQHHGPAHVRPATIIFFSLIGLISHSLYAQTETAPEGSGERQIACWGEPPDSSLLKDILDEPIEVTSGDANIEANGSATFRGSVELRSSSRRLTAGGATYNREDGIVNATGDVEYEDPINKISGESVVYNTETGRFYFENSEFEFADVPARGNAGTVKLLEPGVIELEDVNYTSCPEGNEDWMLRADSIEVDTNSGMGTARGARLSFKGVPFFYWPYFTYPVTDDRRSGLLFPEFGTSDKRGLEYAQPIYWNIAPNQDATFVPRYMEDRGLQLGSEYRFLTPNNRGKLWGDYLNDDDKTGEARWRYDVKTVSMLPATWRGTIKATGVSDDDYYEDMTANLSLSTQTALSREGYLEYYDSTWSVFMQVQDFQTIDPLVPQDEEPYTQVPRIIFNGGWRDGWFGTDYGFESETTYFTRDDSVEGLRMHLRPQVSRTFGHSGLYLKPKAAFDYTAYSLDDQPEEDSSTPDRAAPILSVDTGAIFEKDFGANFGHTWTIEPRALYTYIPERNQDDIPIFDTIRADFNLIQLFEENAYTSYDRLGDANKIGMGITTRIIDNESGSELLTASIGQERLFESGEVTLPGEEPDGSRKSAYIAELGLKAWGNWRAEMRYQLDADERETERSSFSMRWKPDDDKAINIGYRYDRDNRLEQTNFSFAWPLGKSWNAIGRYNWSIEDNEALDQYLGVEYSSCCWGIRILSRRTVSRDSDDKEEVIAVQFVLKGLSDLGSESTESLRRGILGGS